MNEWDKRVKEIPNLRDMVWQTGVFVQHQKQVESILSLFKDRKVLDVACGWGRFTHLFDPANYTGIDYSEEILKIAKSKHPNHTFKCMGFDEIEDLDYDVVFEVISLGPLRIQEKDFIAKFPKAKMIIMFQGEYIKIVNNFPMDTALDRVNWDKEHGNL